MFFDTIELDTIDSNCNDCLYMKRDLEKFNQSKERHKKWQLDYFETMKNKLIERAKEHKFKGDEKLYKDLTKQANDMRFQFDQKEVSIHYGNCTKLNKAVSFIPNTCQLETQHCFVHRLNK